MKEIYKLYDYIPLAVRKEDLGYQEKEEMEHILRNICEQTLIPPSAISSVYLYNNQDIEVTTYKGVLKAVKYSPSDNITYLLHEDTANDGENNVYLNFSFIESEDEQPNIIKSTCKQLGLTYKELGMAIGYSEGALKTAVSTSKVSNSMIKAIELYKKVLILEKELENSNKIKSTLKEWLN